MAEAEASAHPAQGCAHSTAWPMERARGRARSIVLIACIAISLQLTPATVAQDSATGAIRGIVEDAAGARVAGATIIVSATGKGWTHKTTTNDQARPLASAFSHSLSR